MPTKLLLVAFTVMLALGPHSEAANYRRLVNFEWDPIEGATAYDVELSPNKNLPPEQQKEIKKFSFNSKIASWNGKIAPGKYLMRLRSRDYRGVPGEWSPLSEFDVGLDPVKLKFPAIEQKILSEEILEESVKFSWAPVTDAVLYQFDLRSDDTLFVKSQRLPETHFEIKIPAAKKYTWKVTAINKNKIESESVKSHPFLVMGPALKAPNIIKPETDFVRELVWKKVENTDAYDAYIMKLNPQTKKWDRIQSYEQFKGDTIPFPPDWSGGRYQLALRAKGSLRVSSQLSKQIFEVVDGDRSAASEYTALVRTSIDRVSGWFAIASYLITEISYSGNNPEKNSSVSYNARGGTGRIGAGWLSPKSTWGFLGIADLSGLVFNGKTITYSSVELNAVHRQYVGNRAELRLQGGIYMKELPETIGDTSAVSVAGSIPTMDTKISAVGPHLGAEYWYSLTPKLGVQANVHIYYSAVKLSTPNNQEVTPTISTQVGFLGSYRFTTSTTGLLGYARREEKMSYKCKNTTTSFCQGANSNSSTITGNYLNLFAEWSF